MYVTYLQCQSKSTPIRPHTECYWIHVVVVTIVYGGSDLWEETVLIDNVEVEFRPVGKKNGRSAAVFTRYKGGEWRARWVD